MELWVALLLVALAAFVGYLVGRVVAKERVTEERKDAVQRSRAVLSGHLNEQVAPLLPGFPGKASEARFLGKPVDFIVFNGLDGKRVEDITFVEVKSGKSGLSPVERSVRDAVTHKKVRWEEYRT